MATIFICSQRSFKSLKCSRNVLENWLVRKSATLDCWRFASQPLSEISGKSAGVSAGQSHCFFLLSAGQCIVFHSLLTIMGTLTCIQCRHQNKKEPHILFSRCFPRKSDFHSFCIILPFVSCRQTFPCMHSATFPVTREKSHAVKCRKSPAQSVRTFS